MEWQEGTVPSIFLVIQPEPRGGGSYCWPSGVMHSAHCATCTAMKCIPPCKRRCISGIQSCELGLLWAPRDEMHSTRKINGVTVCRHDEHSYDLVYCVKHAKYSAMVNLRNNYLARRQRCGCGAQGWRATSRWRSCHLSIPPFVYVQYRLK